MTLEVAVSRLIDQVAHWTPVRWSKPAATGTGTRAEVVHALIQKLADAAATAEGQPQRSVPHLPNDLALPDQLRVVSADFIAAGTTRPGLLTAPVAWVQTTAASL